MAAAADAGWGQKCAVIDVGEAGNGLCYGIHSPRDRGGGRPNELWAIVQGALGQTEMAVIGKNRIMIYGPKRPTLRFSRNKRRQRRAWAVTFRQHWQCAPRALHRRCDAGVPRAPAW